MFHSYSNVTNYHFNGALLLVGCGGVNKRLFFLYASGDIFSFALKDSLVNGYIKGTL